MSHRESFTNQVLYEKMFETKNFLIAAVCCTLAQNVPAFADTLSEPDPTPLVGMYAGIYGGGGSMMSGVELVQLATALYDTDHGGPIAVNAKGSSNFTN